MDLKLDKIITLISELEVNPYIILMVLFLLFLWVGTIWVLKDAIGEKLKKSKLSFPKITIRLHSKHKIKDLHKHSVFKRLENLESTDYVFYSMAGGEKQPDISKTRAFNDFLKVKMKSTREHMGKIIDQTDESIDDFELRNIIDTEFNNCNCNVETLMLKRFEEKGLNPKYSGILMEKFISVRKVAMDNYSDTFDDIFATGGYNSNYDLLHTVLFMVQNEGIQMVTDCIKSFEQINGAFLEVEY